MTWLNEFGRFSAVFPVILLNLSFQGAFCELVVSAVGPALLNAEAGTNVTLPVSFTGASDPVIVWLKGDLPVLTWFNSNSPPDIAENKKDVLSIDRDGSLNFVNVSPDDTGRYTVQMTKAGLAPSVTNFTLNVFERFRDVTLTLQPNVVEEGIDQFILQYDMSQGVVEQQLWLFGDQEINPTAENMMAERSLVILKPNRTHTGRYTLSLSNPFDSVKVHMNISVLYGPDKPILQAHPAQLFYVTGDFISLLCQAEGYPQPTAKWVFGGETLSDSSSGVLNLTNVQPSHGGVYTCILLNEKTEKQLQRSIVLKIYEKPPGNPNCSVHAVNMNTDLQFRCVWWGGTPQAQLSFPELNNTMSGAGSFILNVTASENVNKRTVTCMADHPVEQNKCNVTATSPAKFLPTMRTTVDSEGKIVVAIHCISEASPPAVVFWFKNSEAVTNGTTHQISNDTTQLTLSHYNASNFLQNYTCNCRNPLGSQRQEIQLQGPSISDFSAFLNQDGTIVTLTWEVPPTSIVTGFDIQLKGPKLPSENLNGTQTKANRYRTIQQKPGSARSTDILDLDPDLTYRFRVVPKALTIEGESSDVRRVGPGEGLSGPAIAGIAAGIPCSLLFLFLLGGLIYLCVKCYKDKTGPQARYPVSRAVEKVITTQTDKAPHNLLTGGQKSPPDYNRLHQTPSERSSALPTFVPPPPVRVATTV